MTFDPTPEQADARELFLAGEDLVIEAGAGTGKTATLELLAAATPRSGAYIAFNRAIVAEAGQKMPGNVTCSTAHSLAFRAVGHEYQARLDGERIKANTVARILGIEPFTVTTAVGTKRLAAGFLAGHVLRAVDRFCQSADTEPGPEHFKYLDGIDLPETKADGTMGRGWANNREVRRWLAGPLRRAWEDLSKHEGRLRFNHGHYLKLWHLAGPVIPAEFILFDEAQDANPVMLAIVAAQEHAQRVYVGDSQQEIYGFTGAINALATVEVPNRTFLTQSFRFGPAIAAIANMILGRLDAELRLRGTPTIASVVGPIDKPDVILTRTNAKAVDLALRAIADGGRPHVVGGATEVVAFARGAKSLMDDGWTAHPELACFDSWEEVEEYVDRDVQGDELRLLVDLVNDFGAETIITKLGNMIPERDADLVISTAHKSKGREWDAVRLAGDFPNGLARDGFTPVDPEPEEMRLVYVAATRARRELDLGPAVTKLLDLDAMVSATSTPPAGITTDIDLGVVSPGRTIHHPPPAERVVDVEAVFATPARDLDPDDFDAALGQVVATARAAARLPAASILPAGVTPRDVYPGGPAAYDAMVEALAPDINPGDRSALAAGSWELPVVTDETVPPGVVELRAPTGETLARLAVELGDLDLSEEPDDADGEPERDDELDPLTCPICLAPRMRYAHDGRCRP